MAKCCRVIRKKIKTYVLYNKQVLRDPRQKRFFKAKDISDLFQLGDEYAAAPRPPLSLRVTLKVILHPETPNPKPYHAYRYKHRGPPRAGRGRPGLQILGSQLV